jgi:hypothetical protein
VNLLMHEAKVLKVQNCGNHDARFWRKKFG